MIGPIFLIAALEASQDLSCVEMDYLPKSNVYFASYETVGTFCDVDSSCDGKGHCVDSLCESCAADMDCVLYSACLQGFYPDKDCEEFSFGKTILETCF